MQFYCKHKDLLEFARADSCGKRSWRTHPVLWHREAVFDLQRWKSYSFRFSLSVYSETVLLFRNATRVCVLCVADEVRNDEDG